MADQPATGTTNDVFDDIFGSAPGSPTQETQENEESHVSGNPSTGHQSNSERSDIPRLRSTHVTNGYRDGIAESKAQHVQDGFDEGFSLGAVLGLKAGHLLGVLEGVVRAVNNTKTVSSGAVDVKLRENVTELCVKARDELRVQSLFSSEWFGDDGIWTFEVGSEDEDVTFRDVADAHPLVRKWKGEVEVLMGKLGVELKERSAHDVGEEGSS